MEFNREQLRVVLETAGIDEDHVRWDYSGRYMYGKTCFGFTADLISFGAFMVQLGMAQVEWEASEQPLANLHLFVNDVRTDDMGRRTIYYWPSIRIV